MACKGMILRVTGIVLFSYVLTSQAIAQDVEFFDGTFNMSDWESNVYYADDGAGMGPIVTQSGTGNPGAYLEMTFEWNEGISGPRAVYVFFKNLNATYDPSVQGAIASIDVSEDGRVVSDSHGAASVTLPMRLALEQDGNIYSNMIDLAPVQNQPFPADWVTVSETGQVAANFPIRSGTGPPRPDFSETGSEIHFGFVRANSTTVRVRELTTAIDNWRVTIHPEAGSPAPGTADLAIDKTADILEVNPGVSGSDQTTFTITVTNNGPEAINAVATDQLPAEMIIAAGQSPVASLGSYDVGSGEWTIGTLAADQAETLTIPVQVVAGTTGCITNTASVAPAAGETTPEAVAGNNSAEQTISTPGGCPDLSIMGRARDLLLNPRCMDVYFEVGVTNHGIGDAADVKVHMNSHATSDFFQELTDGATQGPGYMDCDHVESFLVSREETVLDLGTIASGVTRWVTVLTLDEVPINGDDFEVTINYRVETSSDDPDMTNNSTIYSQTVIRVGGDGDDDDGGGSGGCFIGTGTDEKAVAP